MVIKVAIYILRDQITYLRAFVSSKWHEVVLVQIGCVWTAEPQRTIYGFIALLWIEFPIEIETLLPII